MHLKELLANALDLEADIMEKNALTLRTDARRIRDSPAVVRLRDAQREHDRVDSLTVQGEEYAAHGDDRPHAVGQYGPVNDAGERGM